MMQLMGEFNQFKGVTILPMGCTASPQHGSWACKGCWMLVEKLNQSQPTKIPYALRDFLKFAAGHVEDDDETYTKEKFQRVQKVLCEIRFVYNI